MRIGHISDLHLRAALPGTSGASKRRSRDMPARLGSAVAWLAAAAPDLVAVTGDLVDHPHEAMNAPATLRAGRRDLERVVEILSQLPCPWVALPGNHDHPGLFAEVVGDAVDLEVAGHRVISFHDWDTDDPHHDPPVEAAAHVPRRHGEQRARFDAILADGDPRPQIHLQHYLITPRHDDGWPHTYADGKGLRDALATDVRVRLVLSGHYHPGSGPQRADGTGADVAGDGPWFVVAPAFCEAPHPVLLYELDAGGGLRTTRVDMDGETDGETDGDR